MVLDKILGSALPLYLLSFLSWDHDGRFRSCPRIYGRSLYFFCFFGQVIPVLWLQILVKVVPYTLFDSSFWRCCFVVQWYPIQTSMLTNKGFTQYGKLVLPTGSVEFPFACLHTLSFTSSILCGFIFNSSMAITLGFVCLIFLFRLLFSLSKPLKLFLLLVLLFLTIKNNK